MGGTSQAAPHVTGTVALYKTLNHTLSTKDILGILKKDGSNKNELCGNSGKGYLWGTDDNDSEPLIDSVDVTTQVKNKLLFKEKFPKKLFKLVNFFHKSILRKNMANI